MFDIEYNKYILETFWIIMEIKENVNFWAMHVFERHKLKNKYSIKFSNANPKYIFFLFNTFHEQGNLVVFNFNNEADFIKYRKWFLI